MGQLTAYDQIWRVTDGAVRDALRKHPDYLTPKGRKSARRSIVKRVAGTILSFAVQAAARQPQLADMGAHSTNPSDRQAAGVAPAAGDEVCMASSLHSYAHVNEVAYQAIRRALFGVTRREVRRDANRFKLAREATTASLRSRSVGVGR